MNCLIHIAAMCIFDPSNAYVTAYLETPPNHTMFERREERGTVHTYEGEFCQTHWCRGPVGEVRIGMVTQLSRQLTLDYGFAHRSRILEDKDRGSESFYTSITWRPFK